MLVLPAVTVPAVSNTIAASSVALALPSSVLSSNSSADAAINVSVKVVEFGAGVWSQRVQGEDTSQAGTNGNITSVGQPVLQSNLMTVDVQIAGSSSSSASSYRPSFIANLSHIVGSSDAGAQNYEEPAVLFSHNCTGGVSEERVLFDCPGNVTQFNLTCFGSAAAQVVRSCPVLRQSCNLVSLQNLRITDRTYCAVVQTTRLYTVCQCGGQTRRRLSSAHDAQSEGYSGYMYGRSMDVTGANDDGGGGQGGSGGGSGASVSSSAVSVGVMSVEKKYTRAE